MELAVWAYSVSTFRKQAQGKRSWWDGFLLLLKHHTGDDAFLGLGDVKTVWGSSLIVCV